jgi:hypothetical protein
MPEERNMNFADMEANVKRNICTTLRTTFDEIAKTAMRASSEFSSDVENRSVRERLINAHAVITLIIDNAMRGLGEATTAAMMFATVSTMKDYEEPET